AVGQVVHFFGESVQVQLVGVLNVRNDQVTAWQGHRHAYVNVFVADNVVAVNRNVDHREILDRFGNGIDEDGRKGQVLAFALLVHIFPLVAPVHDVGHVGLHERSNVRG